MAQVFLAQGVDSVLEQPYAARGIGIASRISLECAQTVRGVKATS